MLARDAKKNAIIAEASARGAKGCYQTFQIGIRLHFSRHRLIFALSTAHTRTHYSIFASLSATLITHWQRASDLQNIMKRCSWTTSHGSNYVFGYQHCHRIQPSCPLLVSSTFNLYLSRYRSLFCQCKYIQLHCMLVVMQ